MSDAGQAHAVKVRYENTITQAFRPQTMRKCVMVADLRSGRAGS